VISVALFARMGPESPSAIQLVITIYNEELGMLKHYRRGPAQARTKPVGALKLSHGMGARRPAKQTPQVADDR
ncbi:MAG: hypothetical protein DLM68_00130, partial [Hyphomicrobiales bacterium]